MGQEYKSVCIIGGGPAGCACAYFLLKAGIDVTVFDYGMPLRTILPTGGGRCNLAHAEYNFKDLTKNYPRGEKFLYSVFSRFSTYDTIDFFKEMGVEVYTQNDNRIFPKTNSAKCVRNAFMKALNKVTFVRENVLEINGSKIKTDKAEYLFSDIVIASGGKSFKIKGLELHDFIPFKPSLVGFNADIKTLGGISLTNVFSNDFKINGDIIFTHYGISGPLIYTISSLKARDNFPFELSFNLHNEKFNLQELLEKNAHKDLKNIISKELKLPINFVKYLLNKNADIKAKDVKSDLRDEIIKKISDFKVNIYSPNKGEETVSAGGVNLKEINPKTMESKKYSHIYFIGEVLDIDGFCGGFNLQNCWSTAYIASEALIHT